MLGPTTFRFLNVEGSLQAASDWDDARRPHLWRFNLHYFDDLTARDADARCAWHRDLVARWMTDNPPGSGTGWNPYPTSLRVVNWIKWMRAGGSGDGALDARMIGSLAIQARCVESLVEHHIGGNHLIANAKALLFAGATFRGPEADRWLRFGHELLVSQLDEQILPDGGHYERSPMYQATVLEDVLDLVNLGEAESSLTGALVERLRDTATRMLFWLRVMTHPDGDIAFFNDAAFGIAGRYAELAAYARRLKITPDERAFGAVESLPDSGYHRLTRGPAVLLCDAAPVGPDHLPAHAHADTLSFELSIRDRRQIVNTGTSTYEPGPERQRQRATAAHNTVEVDGEDSSEVWSGFRVARRARPEGVSARVTDGAAVLEAGHDGYRRLRGRVTHRRRWTLSESSLLVEDALEGRCDRARARFHLHPDARPRLTRPDGGLLATLPATWHPAFGVSRDNMVVDATARGSTIAVRIDW